MAGKSPAIPSDRETPSCEEDRHEIFTVLETFGPLPAEIRRQRRLTVAHII
jgi:hypothetical protein